MTQVHASLTFAKFFYLTVLIEIHKWFIITLIARDLLFALLTLDYFLFFLFSFD